MFHDPNQAECEFVTELPAVNAPPIARFFGAAYYTGPGCRPAGGGWRFFHDRKFKTREAVAEFLVTLDGFHAHRRVYFIK